MARMGDRSGAPSGAFVTRNTDENVTGVKTFEAMPEAHSAASDATPISGRTPVDGKTVGSWNIVHNGIAGDLFHFTTGPATAPSRAVSDAVTTAGSPTVTSATAAFTTGSAGGVNTDVGKPISGPGIPANSYIGVVNSATSIGLSASADANVPVNATASASGVSITIGAGNTNGAVIAIGVDQGGTGIITRAKGQGVALHVDCMDTVTSSTGYGAYMYHASHVAPFSYWQAATTATQPVVKMAPVAGDTLATGLKWFDLYGNAVGGATQVGSIYADTGLIDWRRSIQTIAPNASVTPLLRVADEATTPSEAYLGGKTNGELGLRVYRFSGTTTTTYAFGWLAESDRFKLKAGQGPANKGAEVFSTMIEVRCNAGLGNLGQMAFFGATPVNRPTAYTQTYATADKTHAARTAATLTDNSGGTSGGVTIAAVTDVATAANAIATLAAMVNKLTADQVDTAQLANAVVDDLQALGLAG